MSAGTQTLPETSSQTDTLGLAPHEQAQLASLPAMPGPITVNMAPPFTGWQRFRTYPPAGFWTAVRHNDSNGEIVMQLGREGSGSSYYRRGILKVGWKKNTPAAAGTIFRVVFSARPITLRPNGGFIIASLNLILTELVNGRPTGPRFVASGTPRSYQQTTLEVEVPKGADYEIVVQGALNSFYWGTASPYGEIIGRFSDVDRIVDPWAVQALQAADGEGAPDHSRSLTGPEMMGAHARERQEADEKAYAAAEKHEAREVGSAEEAARRGLAEFES